MIKALRDSVLEPLDEVDALALARIAGGTRLHIPRGRRGDGFERLVGRQLAERLIDLFGGSSIYVPRLEQSKRVKLSRVIRLTRNGHGANAIARRLGCSVRVVYRKRADARDQGRL